MNVMEEAGRLAAEPMKDDGSGRETTFASRNIREWRLLLIQEFSREGFETTAAHQSVVLARAKRVHPLGMRHVTNFSRLEAPLTQLLDMDIGPTDPRGEGDVFFPEKGIGKWMGKLSESATPPSLPQPRLPSRRLIKCPLA